MYLIFGGERYYASGGANDLIETHEDESCAVQRAVELIGLRAVYRKPNPEDIDWDEGESNQIEWSQVYSVELGEIIYKSDNKPFAENDGVIGVINNES